MSDSSLDAWLHSTQRDSGSADFVVFDVSEHAARDGTTRQLLESLVSRFIFHPKVLEGLRAQLGEKTRLALDAATPSTSNLRAGAFGEALSAEICEQWHAYVVPLRRLRFSGGSPPGTDLLALRIENDTELTEVCYIECKLRTTGSTGAALDAHQQLVHSRQERMPAILRYVVNHLAEVDSPLFPMFMNYMESRSNQPAGDSYRIALTWEDSNWSERALKNLQDGGVSLKPLAVDVIRIAGLRHLVEEIYKSLGVQALNDDHRPD